MESESLHEPAALAFFELDVEEKPATIDEVGLWALQFVEASFKRCELWNSIFRALHPPAVNLTGEVLSQLPPKQGGRFYQHRAQSGLHLAVAISRQRSSHGPPESLVRADCKDIRQAIAQVGRSR